jgi:hypothetical protein
VDGSIGVRTPAPQFDDHHDDDCFPQSSRTKTPAVPIGKRRNVPNTKYIPAINFEEHTFVPHKKIHKVYKLIKANL